MTLAEVDGLRRENACLRRRCARLEEDVVDLSSQVTRLQRVYDRARTAAVQRPDPLGGGQ
jgi:hypothetical protein